MKLNNIYATPGEVYIFYRNIPDKLLLEIDDSFFPYVFVPDDNGVFVGYDGRKLRKVYSDVIRLKKITKYEGDLDFTKQYILDNVDEIEKSPIRYVFIDIEVLVDHKQSFDDMIEKVNRPVSCITMYDNVLDKYFVFFIGDYYGKSIVAKEQQLLKDFVETLKDLSPDLILGWNILFDYRYLYKRVGFTDLSKTISPVGMDRYVGKNEVRFPVGISILDYMGMYRKYNNNKAESYTLDNILAKELGKGKTYANMDFSKVTEELKLRNMEDVEGLVKLEKKLELISYFDSLRRISKCQWEELPGKVERENGKYVYYSNNSKIIDMLCLSEARKMGIVLPTKTKDKEKNTFQGAFREAFKVGVMQTIQKLDLSSAYPTSIIDFCLDSSNIVDDENLGIKINKVIFKQNPDALLPRVARSLIEYKSKVKEKLNSLKPNTEEYSYTEKMYASIKSVVNSLFGVVGLNNFRLYDIRIPSTITFLIRDLLKYVVTNLTKEGYEVVYVDTDSVMIATDEDMLDKCNALIQQWAQERYGKDKVQIQFTKEGVFEKLFILAKCRYIGLLRTEQGLLTEIKGLEAKRKDSSEYMKEFQKELFDFIFELEDLNLSDKEKEERLDNWVLEKMEAFFEEPLTRIAIPVRYINKDYKNKPIWIRALENAMEENEAFYNYVLETGSYYYIYDKKLDVVAFDKGWEFLVKQVDWDKMLTRNIVNKIRPIYEALGYDITKLLLEFSKKHNDIVLDKKISKKLKCSLDNQSLF